MKKIGLIVIVIIVFTLTGCMKSYPLTDQQSDIIAEYAAAIVLNNDKDYASSLTPMNVIMDNGNDAADPEDTQDADDHRDALSANSTFNEGSNQTDGQAGSGVVTGEQVKQYTFSEVIGNLNYDIKYQGYELCDIYPEETKNPYFSLYPREGNQLLVVSFRAANISEKKSRLNLNDPSIVFRMIVDEKTSSKPLLSLLENDLQYMDVTLKAGESENGLLIFEVPKETDMSNIYLSIKKGDKVDKIMMK